MVWTLVAETAAFWGNCLSDRPAGIVRRGKASQPIFLGWIQQNGQMGQATAAVVLAAAEVMKSTDGTWAF
jgi:hypothetical protein